MSLFSRLSSIVSKSKTPPTIGASVGHVSQDEFGTYSKILDWVKNTQGKLPPADPALRKDSFNVDPLIKGTIAPFLKNVLLQGYTIQTGDNKRFSRAIKEIEAYIEELALMGAFREDARDYLILTGNSYRRRDYSAAESSKLSKLVKLDPTSISTYIDPWDPSVVAYHQHVQVNDAWSKESDLKTVDCWFIPGGMPYIKEEYEDLTALEIFKNVAKKYKIQDKENLRVDSNERIVAMHIGNLEDPAPIDSVILAIWLKRLLLVNSPNLIFRVLSPFVHIVSGKLIEVTDFSGNKQLISSIPAKPPIELEAIDPEKYKEESANYNAWQMSIRRAIKDIIKCLKDGGVFGSGPDTEIKVVESGRNVSYLLIRNLVDLLNEEIGQAFGFPMALVTAKGTELATSRTILQFFNSVYAGARQDYQSVADQLIRERFEKASWTVDVEPENPGDPTSDTYTFKDMEVRFELETPDVKDILALADAGLKNSQELQTLKGIGASKVDIQALADEKGYGMLGLDNFDQVAAAQPQTPEPTTQASMVRSAAETGPSGADGDDLSKKLKEAYEAARKTVGDLLGN